MNKFSEAVTKELDPLEADKVNGLVMRLARTSDRRMPLDRNGNFEWI